ncbi:hypothetical protein [Haloactinopolyspora sp.]|uniref:hypothetical protein n=1 Tax=Haloactinopolyspora sp. TaxID=1966353 RepID=UPI00260B5530|nr:hypothetical protein [Haloactinopolyspora sp.]
MSQRYDAAPPGPEGPGFRRSATRMTEDNEEQSPFTRRGFVAATVVVAVIVVLGVVVGINATRDQASPSPTTEPTDVAAPTDEPSPVAGGPSVCGLDGEELGTARLTSAPAVDEWQYQGTVAYPVSAEFGPGETDPAGFRYCFQHTPEGALFAAAYAVGVGTDQPVVPEWIKYFTAPGPYRDQLIQEPANNSESSDDVRLRIAGFRLLAYDGHTARVDVALVGSVQGQTVNMSAVYPLVWSNGDWKVSTDTPEPGSVASIPDLAGYIAWGE